MADEGIVTYLEQLEQWLMGRPIHNGPTRLEGQCCPDFSCCRGVDTMVPREARQRFVTAFKKEDTETVNSLLMMFLQAALSTDCPSTRVYVTGGHPTAQDFTEH